MTTHWFQDMIRTVLPRDARNWLRSPSKSNRVALGFGPLLVEVKSLSIVCWVGHSCVIPRAWKILRRDQIFDPDQNALRLPDVCLGRPSNRKDGILKQSISRIIARRVRYDEGIMGTQASTC